MSFRNHILVVDDDVAVASTAADALRDDRVTIAHSGALAPAAHLPACAVASGPRRIGDRADRQNGARMASLTRQAADRVQAEPVDSSRLRLAVEASGEIIFMTDANGTFTYVNPEFVRVYGYEAPEVVGRATPRILKSGTTVPDDYAALWTQLEQNHVVRREFLNRTKRGALLHIDSSANPIVDDGGKVVGFLAVQRDITTRRRVEAALRESERRYRTLADAAHDSIFIVNRAAQIEYANEVTAARFGMASIDIVGKRLEDLFPANSAAEMWRELSAVFASGTRELFEQRFASPTGDLWLETWVVPLKGEDSEIYAVMGVARDVTQRKILEQQLVQSQKMEAIGRLAGGIAHDFNNLLTAILGYGELVQERVRNAPDILADVNEIMKAGEQAGRLTRQLLAFSRKQPMTRQVVEVNALVADVNKMLGRILGEDVELSVDAAPDIGLIVADPGQIEQVVLNLVVNARDAMPKGGRVTITTANKELGEAFARLHAGAVPGSYVALTVEDNGCGMTGEVLTHVFEPFFTTKPAGQGTGLGLSTVYGIVKQNDGYVTIESEAGVGTTVTVFWPRKADQVHASASFVGSPRPVLAGVETILLVEDELSIRGLMRKTLEPCGYRVLEARDVSHALALAATHQGQVDLLLSDVIMPGLNGPDLAQRIVAQRPTIRILYISGFPNSLVPDGTGTHQPASFLPKPFTPQALAAKVRECLDS